MMHIRDTGQSSGGITLGDVTSKSHSGSTVTVILDQSQHAAISIMPSPRIIIEGGAVYDLAYNPLAGTFDVYTASFTPGDSHDLSSQDTWPQGVAFSGDGRNMYVVGASKDRVYQYSLDAPWDVTTASYAAGDSHDISSQEVSPTGVAFSGDGRNMYVVGASKDRVYQYSLDTPWDVTSASFSSGNSHLVRSQDSNPHGVAFSPDGTRMFVTGSSSDKVHQYKLDVPWNVTSVSHPPGNSHLVRSQDANPTGVAFSADGRKMFVVGAASDTVYQYDLDIPWDVTPASFTPGNSHDVSSKEAGPRDVAFSADGTRMFVTGLNSSSVHQYDLDSTFPITISDDTIPPAFYSAVYSTDEGSLTITFSEPLNGTINYGLLHIRDTGESAGGISLEDATQATPDTFYTLTVLTTIPAGRPGQHGHPATGHRGERRL